MRTLRSKTVCPVSGSGGLDMNVRKWFQNPNKILQPYIHNGMSVLDFGCGPGFFTIEMAQMLNGTGKVVAADLQQGMLDKLKLKVESKHLENVVQCHRCGEDSIGLNEQFDFILTFYMLHEVPDQDATLQEFRTLLKPEGKILVVEPKVHVSKKEFAATEKKVLENGFQIIEKPHIFFSMSMVLSIK